MMLNVYCVQDINIMPKDRSALTLLIHSNSNKSCSDSITRTTH